MFNCLEENLRDFAAARYGLFLHYGLYSLVGHGEWCYNKERIDRDRYFGRMKEFRADGFDADDFCRLARQAGMTYVLLTTMHHDGFMLYDSKLNPYNSVNAACGRDLVAETVAAARKYGLRVHLYHSLNNWLTQPDAVDALESPAARKVFIENTFARLTELVTKFNPIDCLWYDGWWPFNAEQWEGERMNRVLREIQPWLIFNGRNGLPGDFGTPEGHLAAPRPWRPWESCMTLNNNWAYVPGDDNYKSANTLIDMLLTIGRGNGNLVLGVGPEPNGKIPDRAREIMLEAGAWLNANRDAVFHTEVFDCGLMSREGHRGDWHHLCDCTVSGNMLYLTLRFGMPDELVLTGLGMTPQQVRVLADGRAVPFAFEDGKLTISHVSGLQKRSVLAVTCDRPPYIYGCGGRRTPQVPHPPYDPCPSDLLG